MIWVFSCNTIDSNVHFHGIMARFRPKSLLVALTDVLIYGFHAHFDRGLTVRLLLLATLLVTGGHQVEFYPSQTKILEGRTNLRERIFKALFK